ncbi:hypothetical protein [Gordonia soli]|uniref:AbiEi antitoxin C-terminal domain-containing protein n=1 Tax=Gordonia soli NBRC 108243 TaxID=1223545 RepID=M0QJR5_9ACTN|nr:hypothetical protein [Gordonia soli]GAC68699.1 hypothetical protein GS4_17_00870 [Gordonia soli NBRC 108243]
MSHNSAAVLLDMPLLAPDLSQVHFSAELTGRASGPAHVHEARLAAADVIQLDGISVTSIARTACDVARFGSKHQAVNILDVALRTGVLYEVAGRARRHHGIRTLRAALPLADARSESVGKSYSRSVITELVGIPAPDLQVAIALADGSQVRGDFGWRDRSGRIRVIGEFDGRFKYRHDTFRSGMAPEEIVYAEKLREDAIRASGVIVVRWTWDDLRHPERLRAKLLAALRMAKLIAA